MSVYTVATSVSSELPIQVVTVNGYTRRDIICDSIQRNSGLTPSSARFRLPWAMPGDDVSGLQDAEVIVTLDGNVAFRGYMTEEIHIEQGNSVASVGFRAVSILGLLDRLYVGQYTRQPLISFPRRHPENGALTHWSLGGIIAQLFAHGFIDPYWETKVGIGSLWGASSVDQYLELPDVTFTCSTYKDALARLLDLAPELDVREWFTTSKTYLEFFRRGEPYTVRDFIMPTESEGPNGGAFGTAYIAETNNDQIFTRAIGYAAPIEAQITLGTTDPPEGWSASWPQYLAPAWPDATAYRGYEAPLVLSALENEVLKNPGLATPGDPAFSQTHAFIFRRFRLPSALRRYTYKKENIAYQTPEAGDDNWSRTPIQVFRRKYTYALNESTGEVEGTPSTTEFEIVRGAKFDPTDFTITLSEPAIAAARYYVDSNQEFAAENERVDIFFTCTISAPDVAGYGYDTGIRGMVNTPGIANAGYVFSFQNQGIRCEQLGTANYGTIWFDAGANAGAGAWAEHVAGNPDIITADLKYLAAITESCLAERSRRRTEASPLRVPFCAPSVAPGDGIRVVNRGIDNKILFVTSVSVDLVENETQIYASDQTAFTVARAVEFREAGLGAPLTTPTGESVVR